MNSLSQNLYQNSHPNPCRTRVSSRRASRWIRFRFPWNTCQYLWRFHFSGKGCCWAKQIPVWWKLQDFESFRQVYHQAIRGITWTHSQADGSSSNSYWFRGMREAPLFSLESLTHDRKYSRTRSDVRCLKFLEVWSTMSSRWTTQKQAKSQSKRFLIFSLKGSETPTRLFVSNCWMYWANSQSKLKPWFNLCSRFYIWNLFESIAAEPPFQTSLLILAQS